MTDEEQLCFAKEEKATLFTHDTDFLRIAAQWIEEGKTHHGVIYCHQTAYGIGDCIRNLKILATVLTSEDMVNHIEFLEKNIGVVFILQSMSKMKTRPLRFVR